MCFYGLEYPDFFSRILRKCRKEFICYECNNKICKGTQYFNISGKWDGEINAYKICADCETFRGAVEKIEISHGCDSSEAVPGFGQLLECAGDYPTLRVEFPHIYKFIENEFSDSRELKEKL